MRQVLDTTTASRGHWVGDGFPVRSLFSHMSGSNENTPFLMLDYGGPHTFEPASRPRGVDVHPHKGFETVTIVYDGEVEHGDSTGRGGVIREGDVQWMTAGAGILHKEFHSHAYTKRGGAFEMVQLWVNLPAKDKMARPGYQTILKADIPTVDFANGAGSLRVIAGAYAGKNGPARAFTDLNVWDAQVKSGKSVVLDVPEGHTLSVLVLAGVVQIDGREIVREAQMAVLGREGGAIRIEANSDAKILVLTGEPIDEPVASHGPFVMNSEAEIRQAFDDFRSGRFGGIPA